MRHSLPSSLVTPFTIVKERKDKLKKNGTHIKKIIPEARAQKKSLVDL